MIPIKRSGRPASSAVVAAHAAALQGLLCIKSYGLCCLPCLHICSPAETSRTLLCTAWAADIFSPSWLTLRGLEMAQANLVLGKAQLSIILTEPAVIQV